MFIIVTYDVGIKRNSKILKICRKYLTHVQKSVFEGFLEEPQIGQLKEDISKIINPEEDQVSIYRFGQNGRPGKEQIGYHLELNNII